MKVTTIEKSKAKEKLYWLKIELSINVFSITSPKGNKIEKERRKFKGMESKSLNNIFRVIEILDKSGELLNHNSIKLQVTKSEYIEIYNL